MHQIGRVADSSNAASMLPYAKAIHISWSMQLMYVQLPRGRLIALLLFVSWWPQAGE